MPSFDVVSEINLQEVDNAINQSLKEVATRYDFRGSKCSITYEKKETAHQLHLLADDDFKMKALWEIVLGKAIRRGIDPKALDVGSFEPGPGGLTKCDVKLKQGIPPETAKEIVKYIKDSKLKVQAQIQEMQVRVSGKKRDDLQEAIALLKAKSFGLPLQFGNFRE